MFTVSPKPPHRGALFCLLSDGLSTPLLHQPASRASTGRARDAGSFLRSFTFRQILSLPLRGDDTLHHLTFLVIYKRIWIFGHKSQIWL